MAREYRYVSADAHFERLPEVWTHRVEKKYRDQAPRGIKLSDGRDAILSEGRPMTYGGTNLLGGRSFEEFDPTFMDFENTPGCGPPEQRIQEQDADGIDAEVLFTLGVRNPSMTDNNAMWAVLRGFNDYMAEEYCSVAPDRLLGVGILPNIGVEQDLAELEHCARLGLKAIVLHTFPSGKPFPTPEDDKFWAAVLDMEMPVTIHTSLLQRVMSAGFMSPIMKYPREPEGIERPPFDYARRLARYGNYHCGGVEAVQLVLSGVFDRFPKLKIYWAENGIGWVPYFYEQIDRTYEETRYWGERFFGMKPLARLPSEYLKEHAYWGFFVDPVGVKLRHEVGVDRIIWGADFPHEVCHWPHSLEVMNSELAGVPEDEQYKMMAGNAVEFFHLDRA